MRKFLAPVAAVALLLAMVGTALAWAQPTLTANCAPDENSYAWKIHLNSESNYNIDWSFDSGFATFTTVDFGSAGDHEFTTPRGGATLYVRWTSDHNAKASATADGELCEQPSVEQSVAASADECDDDIVGKQTEQGHDECESFAESVPASGEQSVEAGTGTPAGSVPNTSLDSSGSNPLPTILFSLVLLASLGTLAYTNVKVATHRNR